VRLYELAGSNVERTLCTFRTFCICIEHLRAKRQQHVGRTFDEHPHLAVFTVKSGHELVDRIERNFRQARQCFGDLRGIEAAFVRQHQQCPLHRVTDDFSIVNPAVVAGDQRQQQRMQIGKG